MNRAGRGKILTPGPIFVSRAAPDRNATPNNPSALTPTIFHEAWWLEKASAGRYDEVQEMVNGKCVGRLPYLPSRRFGLTSIQMPPLTHFLGPAIDEGGGHEATRQAKRVSITKALIARLPNAQSLWIKCHRETQDTLAFQDDDFLTTVQFTSEIGPDTDKNLWADMRDTARRVIRRAAERLTVVECDDPERFMAFYERNVRERGISNGYDSRICISVISECQKRQAGRILVAIDETGELHAGIFTAWDHASEYYLLTTRRLDSNNGAISMLIWHAILHASSNNITFDLDGFCNPGDTQFFTRFGGVLKPRYCVQKESVTFRFARKFKKSVWTKPRSGSSAEAEVVGGRRETG
jgi:hypothetical protein